MARARDIANIINSGAFLTPDSASATYALLNSGGLVLLNKTTFSGETSVSINNVFSSEHKNYLIICNMQGSTYTHFNMRLKTTTEDNSSNYNVQRSLVSNTAYTGSRSTSQNSFVQIADISADRPNHFTMNILNPNVGAVTEYRSLGNTSSTANPGILDSFGNLNTSTQYTGFNLIVASGTASGTICVYGYKDKVE